MSSCMFSYSLNSVALRNEAMSNLKILKRVSNNVGQVLLKEIGRTILLTLKQM